MKQRIFIIWLVVFLSIVLLYKVNLVTEAFEDVETEVKPDYMVQKYRNFLKSRPYMNAMKDMQNIPSDSNFINASNKLAADSQKVTARTDRNNDMYNYPDDYINTPSGQLIKNDYINLLNTPKGKVIGDDYNKLLKSKEYNDLKPYFGSWDENLAYYKNDIKNNISLLKLSNSIKA